MVSGGSTSDLSAFLAADSMEMKAGEDVGLTLCFAEGTSLALLPVGRCGILFVIGLSSDFVLLEPMLILLILPEVGDPCTAPNDSLNRLDKPAISDSDFKVETE